MEKNRGVHCRGNKICLNRMEIKVTAGIQIYSRFKVVKLVLIRTLVWLKISIFEAVISKSINCDIL